MPCTVAKRYHEHSFSPLTKPPLRAKCVGQSDIITNNIGVANHLSGSPVDTAADPPPRLIHRTTRKRSEKSLRAIERENTFTERRYPIQSLEDLGCGMQLLGCEA